jgi:glutamate-1-semialdehyde 2,1-aminomutase
LEAGLRAALAEYGIAGQVQRVGSLWTLFFAPEPDVDYASAKSSHTNTFARFFHGMLERGVYLPPSQFEAAFISLAHSEQDIDDTIVSAREVLRHL